MKLKYPLILASASPRRKELLVNAGLVFKSVVKPVDESINENLAPEHAVLEIAQNKLKSYKELTLFRTVLCADTIVVHENKIIGKPKNARDASIMLTSLSGKTHQVITGVCIASPELTKSFFCKTEVNFFRLDKHEIKYYVDKFEPFDKGGGYGIQEWIGSVGIKSINGDYFNVVGLPISLVYQTLKDFFT